MAAVHIPDTTEVLAQNSGVVNITQDHDIVLVRRRTLQLTIQCEFRLIDQTRMVTAASELARNAYVFGGGGTATFEILRSGPKVGLRITFQDSGSGIADVHQAMKDGYSTCQGLGLGLGGSERLVHEFQINSTIGEGTRVTIIRWK